MAVAEHDKVSVLIPAYNAAPFLAQTLDSVLAQNWPALDIIVVDDGSRDDTVAIALGYASRGVRVVTQANAGASAARNHAFSLATGTYIQYLDADDLLHPDKIRTQLACLRAHPGQLLSSSYWAMFYNEPGEQAPPPSILWQSYADPTQWLIDAWTSGSWMQPSAWLAHRSLIEVAGPWNETLSLHDDGEFFCRVVLASQGIVFCDAAHSYYRKGIASSLSSKSTARAVRSHLQVAQLYTQQLLARRNDAAARAACADVLQRFIYEQYPAYPKLLAIAETKVRQLGGSQVVPFDTPAFQKVTKLVGWRISKRLQNFVYRYGLNPAAWQQRT